MAATITAIATLFTALGGVILSFTVLIPLLRSSRKVAATTEHVQVLVNSNHDMQLRREEVLIEALQRAGIAIPPNAELKRRAESNESSRPDATRGS